MRLVYFIFKHCVWAFSCSYQRWKKRMEIVTRNKWENISRLFTRLEEESWSGRKPFSQDCSPCQTEFFLQANFLLFTQFNDLLKLNLVCYKVFSLGETKVSSPPLSPLKKVPFDEMTSWHTFFKGSPTFIDLTSFVQQSTQGTLLQKRRLILGSQ